MSSLSKSSLVKATNGSKSFGLSPASFVILALVRLTPSPTVGLKISGGRWIVAAARQPQYPPFERAETGRNRFGGRRAVAAKGAVSHLTLALR